MTASDRMITAADVQYEPLQQKIAFFDGTMILVAGDIAIHSQAILDTQTQIRGRKLPPYDIAQIYGRSVQAINRRHAENQILGPLGLNTDTFLAQQKEFSELCRHCHSQTKHECSSVKAQAAMSAAKIYSSSVRDIHELSNSRISARSYPIKADKGIGLCAAPFFPKFTSRLLQELKMAIVDKALRKKLPSLAVDFFVVFSRFECAMKRSGVYARGDDTVVEPDWDRLSLDLGDGFLASVIEKGVASVLISAPPKKQIRQSDGSLGWRDSAPVTTTLGLFLAIKRARNNLLHGGKYRDDRDGQYGVIRGSERSDTLLKQSLNVLEMVLEIRPEISHHFQP